MLLKLQGRTLVEKLSLLASWLNETRKNKKRLVVRRGGRWHFGVRRKREDGVCEGVKDRVRLIRCENVGCARAICSGDRTIALRGVVSQC